MRPRPSYANVVSSIALFLVLTGGAAYALDGSNTVFSDDIVNNEVRTADIRDANLTTADIRANSITSGKIADDQVGATEVADNSLTGTDIDESSLLGVNADKVDGGDLCRTGGVLTVTEPDSFVIHRVCEQGALRVEAICGVISERAVTANLRLDTSVDDSFYGIRGDSASQDGDFDAADGVGALTSAGDDSVEDPGVASQPASFYAGTAAGAQLSGTAGSRATLNGDGSGTCDFVVGAIG